VSEFAVAVLTLITAVLTPIIGLLVWTIRKLVQAQIDYVAILSNEFSNVNTNLRTLRNEVAVLRERITNLNNPDPS
jgi:cell division protein FtsB